MALYEFMIDLIPDELFIILHHLLLQPIWLHTMNKQSSVTLLEFIVLIPDMYNMFVNVRNGEYLSIFNNTLIYSAFFMNKVATKCKLLSV